MKRWMLLMMVIALAGCGTAATTSTATTEPTTQTTTTPTTASTTTTTTVSTTTTAPSTQVVVYLMVNETGNDYRPGPFLVPVVRDATGDDLTAALTALLSGATEDEQQMIPAMSTAIPEGTQLLDTAVVDGVATINFTDKFAASAGSFAAMASLAQVVYTATRFEGIDSVLFELDGTPVTTFSAEGIELDGPQTREDYQDLVPMIFVDQPAYGGELGNPAQLTGVAAVFEATFHASITDADGLIIAEPPYLMSSEGMGWGTFDVTIDYDVDEPQWGSLIVWEDSAKDGSQINVREYRVWLTPAP